MEPRSLVDNTYGPAVDYAAARSRLMRAEDTLSLHDRAWDEASPIERTANDLVQTIRHEETEAYFRRNNDGCEVGQEYWRSRDWIQTSRIARIAAMMPKGALLHCHLDAMVPPIFLLQIARRATNLHIRVSTSLSTSETLAQDPSIEFTTLRNGKFGSSGLSNVFSERYAPHQWMPYTEFLQGFPEGSTAAEQWIAERIVFNTNVRDSSAQSVNGHWHRFNQCFLRCRGLMYYETSWRESFRYVIRSLIDENVQYAEIRLALHRGSNVISDDGERLLSHFEMIQILRDTLRSEKAHLQNTGAIFHGIRVIYATLRNSQRGDMLWCIDNCVELKKAFPDFVCGFDMCGQEDAGHPLTYWVPELLQMRQRCNELGLDIPFLLHAGETLNHGGESDANVLDAILLGTKRIGHGFSINKHPVLIDLCKERNIALECCPISNELLGLCRDIRGHPLWTFLAAGLPCTIGNDDPGFFQSTLSHEWYQIIVGAEIMNLTRCRELVQCSIDYSNSTSNEKQDWMKIFRRQWEAFVENLLSTDT